MRQICGDCGSGNIREDYDERHRRVISRHCYMCGSKNIREVEKEEGMSEKKKCSVEGCDKFVHIDNMCDRHYREKYGHPYVPAKKREKRGEGKKKASRTKANRKIKQKNAMTPAGQVLDKAREERTRAEIKKLEAEANHWKLRARHLEDQLNCSFQNKPMDADKPRPMPVLQIDFTGHDELFQMICEEAKKEFRPVEFQILYLLDAFREVKNGSIPDPAER